MQREVELLYGTIQRLTGSGSSLGGSLDLVLERAHSELERCRQEGIRLISAADAEWPRSLERLRPPVHCLFARGAPLTTSAKTLAVVGSRSPTPYGLDCCGRIVRPLARRGVEIWSGLARGIDQTAHLAALDSSGITRAVLGAGLLRPYPAGSENLIRRIAESGTVLSEYPPTFPARRHYFPRRNAILATIARDVLVVQAAERSGSLLTAWMALEIGGSVLAVPDRIDEPLSRGGFALLREGAVPIGSAADVVESMGWELPPEAAGPTDDPLLEVLGDAALGIEEIALRLGQPLSRSLAAIARAEADHRIRRTDDGRYVRT